MSFRRRLECSGEKTATDRGSKIDQITIFTSFPSPSVAVHILRKRSVEAVNSARRKRMFLVVFKQLFSIFVENRQILDQILKIRHCGEFSYEIEGFKNQPKSVSSLVVLFSVRGRLHEPSWLGRRAGSVCRDDSSAWYYKRRASPSAAKFRSCLVKRWLHRRA